MKASIQDAVCEPRNGLGYGIRKTRARSDFDDSTIVANSGIHSNNYLKVFIEDQPAIQGLGLTPTWFQTITGIKSDFGTTHSITLIADTVATGVLLQKVDTNADQARVNDVLSTGSNARGIGTLLTSGQAESDSLESIDDALEGGEGEDTHVVDIGDGVDTLRDEAGVNRVRFGAGITLASLAIEQFIGDDGTDTLSIGYEGGTLEIANGVHAPFSTTTGLQLTLQRWYGWRRRMTKGVGSKCSSLRQRQRAGGVSQKFIGRPTLKSVAC